jgi:hypothetical protein
MVATKQLCQCAGQGSGWHPKNSSECSRRVQGESQKITSVYRRNFDGSIQNRDILLGKYPGWEPKSSVNLQLNCRVASKKALVSSRNVVVWFKRTAPWCSKRVKGGSQKMASLSSRSVQVRCQKMASVCRRIVVVAVQNGDSFLRYFEGGSQNCRSEQAYCRR